jgi:hypothetical protein
MLFQILFLSFLVCAVSFRSIEQPARNLMNIRPRAGSLQQKAVWGNYNSDGTREGLVIFGLAALMTLKVNFMSVDIRTTYICPTGPNAEKTRAVYETIEGWKCLPFNVHASS